MNGDNSQTFQDNTPENNPEVLQKLQNIKESIQTGQAKEAVRELEILDREYPENRQIKTLLALAYTKAGELYEAEKLYNELIGKYPEEILFQVRLAALLIQLERDREAQHLLEDAKLKAPDSKEVNRTLGLLYLRMREWKKAVQCFEKSGDQKLIESIKGKLEESEGKLPEREIKSLPPESPEEGPYPAEGQEENIFSSGNAIYSPPEEEKATLANKETKPLLKQTINELAEQHQLENEAHFSPTEEEPNSLNSTETKQKTDIELSAFELKSEAAVNQPIEKNEDSIPVSVLPPMRDPEDFKAKKAEFDALLGKRELPQDDDLPFPLHRTELIRENKFSFEWADPYLNGTEELFYFTNNRLIINISERVFVRLKDLAYIEGKPSMHIEYKKYKDEIVNQVFGPPENPIVCIEGEAKVILRSTPQTFRIRMSVHDEELFFFKEGVVLAFSPTIQWENGRIPSEIKNVEDISIDQFWGQGELILETSTSIWSITLDSQNKVRVPPHRLIGWKGKLYPKIVRSDLHVENEMLPQTLVEFKGNGIIFISI